MWSFFQISGNKTRDLPNVDPNAEFDCSLNKVLLTARKTKRDELRTFIIHHQNPKTTAIVRNWSKQSLLHENFEARRKLFKFTSKTFGFPAIPSIPADAQNKLKVSTGKNAEFNSLHSLKISSTMHAISHNLIAFFRELLKFFPASKYLPARGSREDKRTTFQERCRELIAESSAPWAADARSRQRTLQPAMNSFQQQHLEAHHIHNEKLILLGFHDEWLCGIISELLTDNDSGHHQLCEECIDVSLRRKPN